MYQDVINEHFLNPRNVGEVSGAGARGTAASFVCGAVVRVTLKVDGDRRIVAAKFKAAGCSFLVAANSILTSAVLSKTTAEAAVLVQSPAVLDQLGSALADKQHCGSLAREAMLNAIRNYSDAARAEWAADDALICTCFGISEQRIENEILSGELRTVAEVTQVCKAGAGCGSCYKLIEDILDDYLRTRSYQSL